MRDKVGRRASLAGWLFADLSLVLAILFIGSTITEADNDSAPTTTTIAPENVEGNSLNVNPIKVTVSISNPDNQAEVQTKLESALKAVEKLTSSTKFGVVIVHGGTGGDLELADAKNRAARIATALGTWDRLTPKRWISGDQAIQSLKTTQYQFTLLEDLTTAGG